MPRLLIRPLMLMPSDETLRKRIPPKPNGPPSPPRPPLPGASERLKQFDQYAQPRVFHALKRAAKLNPPKPLK